MLSDSMSKNVNYWCKRNKQIHPEKWSKSNIIQQHTKCNKASLYDLFVTLLSFVKKFVLDLKKREILFTLLKPYLFLLFSLQQQNFGDFYQMKRYAQLLSPSIISNDSLNMM